MAKTRLTQDDWISAGLDALVQHGPQALAAEPLARRIGTTKGSFYWHFKDVPAFHDLLIDVWHTRALAELSGAVAASGSPDQRLRNYGHHVLADPFEQAMRHWAQISDQVVPTLNRLDADRLTFLGLLFQELGLRNTDFARALQATLIGLPQLDTDPQTRQTTFDTLVDTVLAL